MTRIFLAYMLSLVLYSASSTPSVLELVQPTSGSFCCARLDLDELRCFGEFFTSWSSSYEARTPRSEPFPLRTSNDSVVQVSATSSHLCILYASHRVKCVGYANADNRLGHRPSTNTYQIEHLGYVPYLNLSAAVKQVEVGCDHTCLLFMDGKVKCFGRNNYGQTGFPVGQQHQEAVSELPYLDFGPARVTELSLGCQYTCVLLGSGKFKCFGRVPVGYNMFETIAGSQTRNLRVFGSSQSTSLLQLHTGQYHMCGILKGGAVQCVGVATDGQLGYLSNFVSIAKKEQSYPTNSFSCEEHPEECRFVEVEPNVTAVALGARHTCTLFLNGKAKCFGRLDITRSMVPFELDFGAEAVVQLLAGTSFTCALLESGRMKCFGRLQGVYPGNSIYWHQGNIVGENLPFVNFAPTPSPTSLPTNVGIDLHVSLIRILFWTLGGTFLVVCLLGLFLAFCLSTAQPEDYRRWKQNLRNFPEQIRASAQAPILTGFGSLISWLLYTMLLAALTAVFVLAMYFGTPGTKSPFVKVFIIAGSIIAASLGVTLFKCCVDKLLFVCYGRVSGRCRGSKETEGNGLTAVALSVGEEPEDEESIRTRKARLRKVECYASIFTHLFLVICFCILWAALDPKGSIFPSPWKVGDAFQYVPRSPSSYYNPYRYCQQAKGEAETWMEVQRLLQNTSIDFQKIDFVYGGGALLLEVFSSYNSWDIFVFENTVYLGSKTCFDREAMIRGAFEVWLYQSGWWYGTQLGHNFWWYAIAWLSGMEFLCGMSIQRRLESLSLANSQGYSLADFHPYDQYCIIEAHITDYRFVRYPELQNLLEHFASEFLNSKQ